MAVIVQLIPIVVLLFLSALLSGSETAFFNISGKQAQLFKSSGNKMLILTASLLDRPKQLLTSLLFGNMAVNVLYCATSSLLTLSIAGKTGGGAGAAVAVAAFVALLLFGEIVPKSLAYSHSQKFCIAAVPFCYVCVRLLSPFLFFFDFVIISPLVRFFTGPITNSASGQAVTANQLISLIDSSRHRGFISEDENQLFTEVIQLGFLKVRHVMRPRVDMVICEDSMSNCKIQELMVDNKMTKIPVYSEEIDNISGLINLRDLLLFPDKSSRELIKKVDFIPEQKTVESLLEFFRKSKTDTAMVVDEYGGIAGTVSLEDIVEELIGPLETSEQVEAIENIGPMTYRLSGNLAIHDWASVFGVDAAQSRMSTIGGLTTALLGKIPKPGDKAKIRNITLTVEKMRKRRIETLILTLEGFEK